MDASGRLVWLHGVYGVFRFVALFGDGQGAQSHDGFQRVGGLGMSQADKHGNVVNQIGDTGEEDNLRESVLGDANGEGTGERQKAASSTTANGTAATPRGQNLAAVRVFPVCPWEPLRACQS